MAVDIARTDLPWVAACTALHLEAFLHLGNDPVAVVGLVLLPRQRTDPTDC